MFEGTLLDSSTARQPVLGMPQWLISLGIGFIGFLFGAIKLPAAATPAGTNIVLLRALVVGGALMFYSLAVCYAFKDARRQGFNAWYWGAVVIVANLPGFLIYLVYSALKTSDWKRATLPIAYTFEVLVVCFAALVPLIYTQAIPNAFNITKPVLPPSRPAGQPSGRPPGPRVYRPRIYDVLLTTTQIPIGIHPEPQGPVQPPDFGPYVPGVPPGIGGGSDPTLIRLLSSNPGPPPEPPKPASTKRIVLGGKVEAARLIFGPSPEYPRLAIMTRVQGTVRVHAVIGTDGTVQELTLMNGHPLLIKAAMDAVARWRYQPTLLNGEPVEVDTEIDVIFKLDN